MMKDYLPFFMLVTLRPAIWLWIRHLYLRRANEKPDVALEKGSE